MAEKAPLLLEVRRLRKTYGSGPASVEVLRDVELTLRSGEFLAILGPSGSGKSTLLHILGLMDSPSSGEILFEGKNAGDLNERERARFRAERLGFVFQFSSLLPEFTVMENLLLPARILNGRSESAARSRAEELLSGLGLRALGERFPSEISGGERQRVSLARALINKPALLLADEPTGNLDKRNGEMVFKDLKDLAETHGAAVVMVTHNEAARDYAGRVLNMSDGALNENLH